jgi:hypothetical protein
MRDDKYERSLTMRTFSSPTTKNPSRVPGLEAPFGQLLLWSKPLAATRIKEARKLTRGVKVRDDDLLPDDVTL